MCSSASSFPSMWKQAVNRELVSLALLPLSLTGAGLPWGEFLSSNLASSSNEGDIYLCLPFPASHFSIGLEVSGQEEW